MSIKNSVARVHLALLGTAMMWGLNVTAVKLLAADVDATLVASVRTVLAALALTLLLAVDRARMPRWSWRLAAFVGMGALLMVYANQALFASAMSRTSATNAALIMALAPFVAASLEAVFFRKRLGALQLAGIFIAMSGVCVVIVMGRGGAWTSVSTGDLLMLLAVSAFAGGGAIVQRLSNCAEPLVITWLVHVIGAALLVVHAVAAVSQPVGVAVVALDAWHWTLMLYSGVLATALGAVAWGRGIATLGVGRTTSYLSWVPLFGVAFGAVLLGEALNRWHAVGLAAVLLGSVLSARHVGPARPALAVCS
jgi:drug/metabolite transporter (DMT)-like permease